MWSCVGEEMTQVQIVESEPNNSHELLDVGCLFIDTTYQRTRTLREKVVCEIISEFHWNLFDDLIIADMGNNYPLGRFAIVDGGARYTAIIARGDIKKVPCVVYKVKDVTEAAEMYYKYNSIRKPVTSLESYKAGLIYNEPTDIYIDAIFRKNGIKAGKTCNDGTQKGMYCSSISVCRNQVNIDRKSFEKTVEILSNICQKHPVTQYLLKGVFFLLRNVNEIDNPIIYSRFRKRIIGVGAGELQDAARKLAFVQLKGDRYLAEAMLACINKRLQDKSKFKLNDLKSLKKTEPQKTAIPLTTKKVTPMVTPPENTTRYNIGKEREVEAKMLCG